MERNLANAFWLWMKENESETALMPDQVEVVEAFCRMSPASRTGKSFVLNLIRQFDEQTGSNVATLIPYFDRYEDHVKLLDRNPSVDWNPDEQELPF